MNCLLQFLLGGSLLLNVLLVWYLRTKCGKPGELFKRRPLVMGEPRKRSS